MTEILTVIILASRLLKDFIFQKLNGVVVGKPQHMLLRVSVTIHKYNIKYAFRTYRLMSQRWFTHALPTLFNAGIPRPQVRASCTYQTYAFVWNSFQTYLE